MRKVILASKCPRAQPAAQTSNLLLVPTNQEGTMIENVAPERTIVTSPILFKLISSVILTN